jgi:hypothetical protein
MNKRDDILLKIIKALFLVKAVVWTIFAVYYFFQTRTQAAIILLVNLKNKDNVR